jgi:hypothetical protein
MNDEDSIAKGGRGALPAAFQLTNVGRKGERGYSEKQYRRTETSSWHNSISLLRLW